MERLIVTPLASKPGRFSGRLESTGGVIVTNSKQPLADGARELLCRGFDPAAPLTMRHETSAHDSLQPLPIGRWAGWTYEEGETKPLRRVRWMPFPTAAGTQKSTSELSGVPEAIPGQKPLYEEHSGRPLDACRDKAASVPLTMPSVGAGGTAGHPAQVPRLLAD
jgi:hypothetical protein